ncbi:MAG: AraC family transcriptional regulator [Verrucomicrobiota bacterium JB024]|nr:AraC family transcriptional regulator [Verrucomicrobiota bacterium JB024]
MDSLINRSKILFCIHGIYTHEVSKATPRQPYTLGGRKTPCSLLVGCSGILHIGESYNQLKHVLAPDVVLLVPASARSNYAIATPHGKASFYEIVLGEGIATSYFKFLHQEFGLRYRLSSGEASRKLLRDLSGWTELDGVEQSRRLFHLLLQLHQEGKRQRKNIQRILDGDNHLLKTTAQESRFSVQAMASTLGCSTAYLDKRFQERYGLSCGYMLRSLRLEMACELLREGELTLAEIAYECGYANATSLSSALRQATGKPLEALRTAKTFQMDRVTPRSSRAVPRICKPRQLKPTLSPVEPYFHCVAGLYRHEYPHVHDLSICSYPAVHNWVVTLSGKAQMIIDGVEYDMLPGRVCFQPSPIRGTVRALPGIVWERISLRTFGAISYEAIEALTAGQLFFLEIDLDSPPVQLALRWMESWSKKRNQPSAQSSRQAYEWLLSWYELLRRGEYRRLDMPNLYDYRCPTIHQDISTLTQYASESGYSRAHFTRKLMKVWGNPPASIMREQRLARAAQKLQHSRLPIDEISAGANYSHTSSFTRAFKHVYGMTPLQYRYH